MLLYLNYDRNRRQWNKRLFILSVSLMCTLLLVSFNKNSKKKSPEFKSTFNHTMLEMSSGDLKLLTYNIAGLPELISSAKTRRDSSIQEIGKKLNSFDIVNIQEDFNYNRFLYKDNQHPYRTKNMGGVPFGDGLSTLSNYPILSFQRIEWADCNGADCLTPKGFSIAKIQIAKETFLHVYNIHATAQNDLPATEARKKNLIQLSQFITNNSKGYPIIIMGDFNANYAFELDNIKRFQEELQLHDAWVELHNDKVFPKVNSHFEALPMLEIDDSCESIDKVLYRNSNTLTFNPKSYSIKKKLFQNVKGEDLSDHCAVAVILDWHLSL